MDRCLIKNVPGGYVLDDGNEVWRDLGQFVREHVRVFVHPVPSALYLECVQEIEARRIEEVRKEKREARANCCRVVCSVQGQRQGQ